MANTIRSGISDLANVLNKVRNNTTVAQEQSDLQSVLDVLFAQWPKVIYAQMDSTCDDYKAAIASLTDAQKSANAALKDIGKVASAIKMAGTAAKAIDKILNAASKVVV